MALTVHFRTAGQATVVVLDRDGYPVRTLALQRKVEAGSARFEWDGQAPTGHVVPDEAYSFKVDWNRGRERASYFPANRIVEMRSVPPAYFDRHGGTLAYKLDAPSRVHIQAGWALKDAAGEMNGAVMKTIADREPRVAGRIAEHWNGYDESGLIYLPDVPNFVTAIAVTPLPENSVIAFGNRKTTFLAEAARRTGRSALTIPSSSHTHHAALTALDDHSPQLRAEPLDARWSPSERLWIVNGDTLRIRVTPSGPSAAAFLRQPAKVYRFVNQVLVGKEAAPGAFAVIEVSSKLLTDPVNQVSVNWRSDYGPVAANTLRARLERGAASPGGTSR